MPTRTVRVEDGQGNLIEIYEVEVSYDSLDATGALATLLVVEGVLSIDDAAHSVGTVPDHLVHEATAWGVG